MTLAQRSRQDREAPDGEGRLWAALRDVKSYGWLVPGLTLMGVLFIAPIAAMIWDSFTDPRLGLENYRALTSDAL
jgi:putative spermidine/putrescine transport system permease protein